MQDAAVDFVQKIANSFAGDSVRVGVAAIRAAS